MRDDLGPAALAILQHELTHRFVAYHFPNAPIWLNEGMAEFWATLEIKGGTAYFGSPLQSSVRPTGLSQLLDMSPPTSTSTIRPSSHQPKEGLRLATRAVRLDSSCSQSAGRGRKPDPRTAPP